VSIHPPVVVRTSRFEERFLRLRGASYPAFREIDLGQDKYRAMHHDEDRSGEHFVRCQAGRRVRYYCRTATELERVLAMVQAPWTPPPWEEE
jgi:hypothetical protein